MFQLPTLNSRLNVPFFLISYHTQNYNYYGPMNTMLVTCHELKNVDFSTECYTVLFVFWT